MYLDDFLVLSNSKYTGYSTYKMGLKGNRGLLKKRLEELEGEVDVKALKASLIEERICMLENPLPNISDPPPYLYCIGQGVVTDKRVAIIGARQASAYGRRMAYKIAYDFASRGYTVVSGLALGVDGQAHRGALAAGGPTIGVLGSGILTCYPKAHQDLYQSMIRGGKIISEYGLYSKPLKHHFPFRNRLISGLAAVVIVVEARLKSGTMITVKSALDQGKTIYALPGSLESSTSQGSHYLISQGAQIFLSVDQVIEEWPDRIT